MSQLKFEIFLRLIVSSFLWSYVSYVDLQILKQLLYKYFYIR